MSSKCHTFLFSLLLLVAIAPLPARSIAIGEVLDIISVGKDIVITLAKTWNIVDDHYDFSEAPVPFIAKTEKKLFRKMDLIQRKMDELNTEIHSVGIQTISGFMRHLPDRMKLELRLNDLLDYTTRLQVFYRHMTHYVNNTEFERHTLEDFAKTVVSHDSGSVRSLVERIHAFISPSSNGITNTGILNPISNSLQEYPEDISYGLNTIENVWIWARTYSELRGIYALYESFRRFQKLQTSPGRVPSPSQAWIDLTQAVLHDGHSSVTDAEDRITDFIIKEKLFDEFRKEIEGDMQCSTNQSPQQVLYNLYNSIALTELKGYMMMQFSYMLLKLYNKGNFTKEAQLMRDRYEERTNVAIEAVKKAMESANRELWKCDPKKHIPGETYIEITQLLQGYIQNEVDLNPDGTCRESCSEYTYTKSHNCYKNLYCREQRRCNGKIINCRYIDSDMWVCPADSFSGRRYEYVEYENGRVLGRKQGCHKGTVKVDSWWRWLFWHCSYCFCLCDEQGVYSDRYFNMRSIIADIENNKVVTGLRFIKQNRIIHLQIQEGKLLPRGKIDPTTVRWVPVEDYKITDRNIFNGQDYHTLTWEHRSIDLDDLVTDDKHVLTGIRFKKIGSHLNFEIYMTPFNFETGQLVEPLQRSTWKDNSNTEVSLKNPRKQLYLNSPDIPTRSPSPSVPDSKSDQYLEFTHTDLDRDAAQSTVPFLDAQPVESILPVPLAGAGIYHKGRKNFGGFIAPKIITYDFSQHLHVPVEDDDQNLQSGVRNEQVEVFKDQTEVFK